MFGTKHLALCRPCAEGLKADGQRLAALTVKTEKNTCEACGRRRYTLRYERGKSNAKSKSRIAAEAGG